MKLNEIERELVIEDGSLRLNGIVGLPANAKGMVIFAHGSGSGRMSIRNNFVARELQRVKIGTLLLDLLTQEEESDRDKVFDIELLAGRLLAAKKWVLAQDAHPQLPIAFFGASTGAGAALVAAARDPKQIFAVVSRGGRPDLAGASLAQVKAPTLFIVGGSDEGVIELNEEAFARLKCEKEFRVIEGATHLFSEPGALERVALIAAEWFVKHAPRTLSHLIPDEQFL